MQATLYKVGNDTKKLNKTLTNALNIEILIKEDNCDVLNPVIDLAFFDNYIDYNYIYIPNFKRYYFINKPVVMLSGFIRLECKVDVLYTYRDQINSCQVILNRNNYNNKLIQDGAIKQRASRQIMNRRFNGGEILNGIDNPNWSIVLCCIGGATNV